MTRDIPVKFLLICGVLISGLVPLLVATLIGFSTAKNELRSQAFRQLESVRDIKRAQILSYFNERLADITIFAKNPYVAEASRTIAAVFAQNGGVTGGQFHGFTQGRFRAPAPYIRVHDRYFPFLEALTAAYGYYDLFLMDPVSGATCFTIKKETDFGISTADLASPLHDVWIKARAAHGCILSDTQPYAPSGGLPAQFLAASIRVAGRVDAVVAVQISLDAINRIMNERSGLGSTGETYLVGSDLRLRSDSSLDRRMHSLAASWAGAVERHGVPTQAARQGLLGKNASERILNYRGEPVLSAYTLLDIAGVHWVLIAEIAESEINQQIARALNKKILLLLAITCLLLILIASVISVFISRAIRHIVRQLEHLLGDVLQGRIHTRADPASVGIDFRRVVERANALITAFAGQIEETRRLEEHVRFTARLEAIGTLAGGIAHDFNNLLTSLLAYAHLIAGDLPTTPAAQTNLAEMRIVIQRASALVQQVLSFSRQVRNEGQILPVNQTVHEVVRLLRVTLPQKVTIACRLATSHPLIKADPLHIHQIVMNLATNAFHAMPDTGGRLEISSAEIDLTSDEVADLPAGRYFRLSIRDNGSGIPPDILPHIFEPFFTTKPSGQGTGMGLAVVRNIVLNYAGAVTAQSVKGEGSTFHIYLPCVSSDATPCHGATAEEHPPVLAAATTAVHVLFVDDDAAIRQAIGKALRQAGLHVTMARDGASAAGHFSHSPNRFDVVVTDLNMPRCSGLELARMVNKKRPDLPVILTTGYNDLAAPEAIAAAGIDELMHKPFTPEDLLACLQRRLPDQAGSTRRRRAATRSS